MTTTRPGREFTTDRLTNTLRRCAVFVTILITVMILVRYPSLPPEIPIHFNAAGVADGWGARSNILLLSAIMVVLVSGVSWGSRYPHGFNYPFIVERMMVWVACGLTALYASLGLGTVLGFEPGVWITAAFILLISAVVVSIIRIIKSV